MHEQSDWQPKTDAELVQLTLKNQEVFGALIKRYEDRLKRYILRISNCGTDEAEDILQNAFINAYRHLNAFDQEQSFSSWMYRITRNETINTYRKSRVRAEGHAAGLDNELLESLASELNISSDLETKQQREDIAKVLDAMDVKYRDVLVLKYLEGRDYKDISFILKKPMGTIATLLNRAKRRFRERANEMGIDFTTI